MKTLLLTAFLSVCVAIPNATSQEAKDWLTPAGDTPTEATRKENRLDEDQFYECRITRLGTAIERLKAAEFIELTNDLAIYFAGHGYTPRDGHDAYLVRGVFENSTGEFTLFFHDGILVVRHMSLGGSTNPRFCPLIVQLPSPPKKVLIEVGGAR